MTQDRQSGDDIRCPTCGQRVVPLWTEGEWRFYRCQTHGVLVLSPHETGVTDEPGDSRIRR